MKFPFKPNYFDYFILGFFSFLTILYLLDNPYELCKYPLNYYLCTAFVTVIIGRFFIRKAEVSIDYHGDPRELKRTSIIIMVIFLVEALTGLFMKFSNDSETPNCAEAYYDIAFWT